MAELDDLRRAMEAAETRVSPEEVAHVRATLAYGLAEADQMAEGRSNNNRDAFDRFAKLTTVLLAVLVVVQLVLGVVAVKLSASNGDRIAEQKAARKNSILTSCREVNERHDREISQREARHVKAEGFIKALIAQTPPKTPADARKQAQAVPIFLEAIAPKTGEVPTPLYVAGKGSPERRREAGCRARLAKFSKA